MEQYKRKDLVRITYQDESTIYLGLIENIEDGSLHLSPATEFHEGQRGPTYDFIGLYLNAIISILKIDREE
ncbi:MAG TPA: hypothetical protein EYQ69_06165 [Gemmatimonadetes bacterium]|nr:hypothetical protein [Gemmatimonadota bacterium]